ncbi:MAG: LysM peptidoglycan-binding domain-containing protein [Lentisphaeria bacterium]
MKRVMQELKKSAGSVILVGGTLMLLGSGCASWKKQPAPRLLGARGVVPAPYFQPGQGEAAEPGFDEDLESFETPEPVDMEEPGPVEMDSGAEIEMPASVDASAVTYTVKKGDSLWKIAQQYGVSFKELAAYNNIDPDDTLVVGKQLTIPPGGTSEGPATGGASVTEPSGSETSGGSIDREPMPSDQKYTVKSGDSLWVIARRFGVKVADLKRVNDMTDDTIHVGKVLVLPTGSEPNETGTAVPEVEPDTDTGEPVVETTVVEKSEDGDEATEEPETNPLNLLEHTVMENDTLAEIADMYGTTVKAIKRANDDIDNDDDLNVNMTIKVPFE